MKYKNKLVKDIKEEHIFDQRQKELKDKHGIKDSNIVVVEKSNMVKFFIRTCFFLIRILSTAILLILAAVGLLTLIYPDIRDPFFLTLFNIYNQFKQLI